jgi:hypothetical protein
MRRAVRRCPEPRQPPRTAAANRPGARRRLRPPSDPGAASWPAARGTLTASHVRPAGTVTVGVSAHRSTHPAARAELPDGCAHAFMQLAGTHDGRQGHRAGTLSCSNAVNRAFCVPCKWASEALTNANMGSWAYAWTPYAQAFVQFRADQQSHMPTSCGTRASEGPGPGSPAPPAVRPCKRPASADWVRHLQAWMATSWKPMKPYNFTIVS